MGARGVMENFSGGMTLRDLFMQRQLPIFRYGNRPGLAWCCSRAATG